MSRTKRFSRYDFALKLTTPSAGSALDKYKKWKSGEASVSYTRETTSNPGSYNLIYLLPFASESDTDMYETVISARAIAAATTVLGGATVLNHKALGTDTAIISSWEPAKAHVHKGGTGDGTDATSKLTGKKYKKKSGAAAYTFAFGRSGAGDVLLERMTAIKAAAKPKGCTVSFTPERFYA